MKQAITRDLYNYWDALRGERASPDRAEVNPGELRGLLNDTFILEGVSLCEFPFRIIGAHISDFFLSDLNGRSFHELFAEEDMDSVLALLESTIDDPTAIVAGLTAAAPGRASMEIELILLPLGVREASTPRILGALAPATRQAWAGLIAPAPMRLTSLRILRPDSAAWRDPAQWATLPLRHSENSRKVPLRQANLTIYNAG